MSECIITEAGLAALAYASTHSTHVRPAYFKFATEKTHYVDGSDHLLASATAMTEDVWYTHVINYYKIVDPTAHLVEFVCEALPDAVAPDPNGQTWVCGLFLEDDTLFMLAKPDAAFPPTVHQIFRLELAYNNAGALVEFVYPAINTFLLLSDTPDSYAGQAGKLPRVNSAETMLEFKDGIASMLDIEDVSTTSYTDRKGQTLQVRSGETGMELTPVNASLANLIYEDLPFVSHYLNDPNPRTVDIYYFDSGYSGTYSKAGTGAVAVVDIDKDTTGHRTVTLMYSSSNISKIILASYGETTTIEVSLSYNSTTGCLDTVQTLKKYPV